MRDRESIQAFIDKDRHEHKKAHIDILVANAGIGPVSPSSNPVGRCLLRAMLFRGRGLSFLLAGHRGGGAGDQLLGR